MSTLFRSAAMRVRLVALGLFAAFGLAQTPKPARHRPPHDRGCVGLQKKLDDINARFEKAKEDWKESLDNAKTEEEDERSPRNVRGRPPGRVRSGRERGQGHRNRRTGMGQYARSRTDSAT